MSRVAPAAPMPSPGWMIVMSLWLLPVLLGGGTTTWIGFGIIGLAVLKRSWIVAAVVYAILALIVSVASAVLPSVAAVLQIGLIAVGTIHALVANRRWLITLWGRRERGVGLLGRGAASAVPAPSPQVQQSAVPVPPPVASAAPPVPSAPDTQWRPLSPSQSAPITSVPSSFAPTEPRVAAPESSAAAFLSTLRLTPLPGSSTLLPPREPVDPMAAGLEALSAIPAIGPERAARILAAREHGPLDSLQAVADAAGLQGFELVRIRPFLRFPPAPGPIPSPPSVDPTGHGE